MAGVTLPVAGSYIYTVKADISGTTYGIQSPAAATITNPGFSISGGTPGEGILITGGAGTIINEAGTTGTISGQWGVILADGGSVTNDSGATIEASVQVAVYSNLTASASVDNKGTITGAYDGVALLGGGSVTNEAGATITGTNHYGVYIGLGGSVTNAGSISGGANAISFGGIGANTLTLEGGSSLSGNVVGSIASGATNTLILEGTGSTSSVFNNFGTVEVAASANWTLSAASVFSETEMIGNNATLSLGGGSTTAVISGAGDTFTEAATGESVTLSSNNTTFALNASGETVTLSGTGDTVTVTGSNNTITIPNSSTTTLNVTANAGNIEIWAPTISGTAANQATASEAPVKPFSGVTIGDKTNETDTDTLTITVGGTGGALSGTGLVATGTAGVYTISGTASAITTDLDALSFTPTAGAPNTKSTTTFKLSDVTSVYSTPTVDTATSVVDTDGAVAPTITGTVANQTTTSGAAVKPFSGVTIADENSGATDTLTITVGVPGGVLSGAGLSGGTGGVYTISGTASAITTDLDALSFAPTAGAPTTFELSDLSSAYSTPTVNTTTTVIDTRSSLATGGSILGGSTGDFVLESVSGGVLTLDALSPSSALSQIGQFGSNWSVDGFDQFSGGNDLVMHETVGNVETYYLFQMGATAIGSGTEIGAMGVGWQAVGTGDFEGTGASPDVLLQLNNGSTDQFDVLTPNGTLIKAGAESSAWTVAGVGDFNGDGTSDILMQGEVNGQTQLKIENISSGVTQSTTMLGAFGGNWTVDGVGNFGGPAGSVGVLMEKDTPTGRQLAIMTVQNDKITMQNLNVGAVGYNVTLDGIGDFNGDGISDIAAHYNTIGNSTTASTITDIWFQVENNQIVAQHTAGVTGLKFVPT